MMGFIGSLCLGAGIGCIIAAFWFWDSGYRTGYRHGVEDVNAMLCGDGACWRGPSGAPLFDTR